VSAIVNNAGSTANRLNRDSKLPFSQALADTSRTERQRLELVQELYARDSPESDSERTKP
jgi:hypothetical protein